MCIAWYNWFSNTIILNSKSENVNIHLSKTPEQNRDCLLLPPALTKNPQEMISWGFPYVREKIRTPDTLVRSQVLYPAELRTHILMIALDFSAATLVILTHILFFVNSFFEIFSFLIGNLLIGTNRRKSHNFRRQKFYGLFRGLAAAGAVYFG